MRTLLGVLSTCVCFSWNAWSQPYTISTIAGTTRLLDGGSATAAPLREPSSLVFDASGNLYIADESDNRIRKVDKNGIISTYAGTGVAGYSGDGGQATSAALNFPSGIAIDAQGNLYVADQGNGVVRLISTDGTIKTIAGNGNGTFAGDNGPAISAQLDPVAVAVDSKGNYYIADSYNYRIRKVDANGIITTIAGTGMDNYTGDNGPATSATISFVLDLKVDSTGNIYLADYYNLAVREIDTTGRMTTIAGGVYQGTYDDGVPATMAVMVPSGVALDPSGNLYISDADVNHMVIRRMDLSTGLIYTEAGTGTIGFQGDGGQAAAAELNLPLGLVFSGGALYFADSENERVRKIANNIITTVAGTSIRDGDAATQAFLNFPQGLRVDGAGNVVVADTGNYEARSFKLGGNIKPFGQVLGQPYGVAVDAAGNFYVTEEVFTLEGEQPHVLKITPQGITTIIAGTGTDGYSGDGGQAGDAQLSVPEGIAVDAAGNIYFADFGNNVVRKINTQGVITTIAGNGKVAFSGDGGPATSAGMNPVDVAVDSLGDVFIADEVNNRIREVTPNGTITTVAGTGAQGYTGDGGAATAATLNYPSGVTVDHSGNLYIADYDNDVVRRMTTGGLITTIAGTGGTFTPTSGDGGPASAAVLDPWGVAVDQAGNVYVTDSFNDRVRMLIPQVVKTASMTVVSGSDQSGPAGTTLASPLVLKVADSTGAGIPGVYVSFTVSPAGAATITPSPALTLNDGTVSLTVTLGSSLGPITITATTDGVPALSFSITAISSTAPSISAGGIVSAGLSSPPVTALSPNAIVSIFGTNFAPAGTAVGVTTSDLVNGALPTNLAGVCVEFGSVRTPMFAVYPTQINVQVPAVAAGNVSVQVITGCDTAQSVTSQPINVAAQSTAPEFFYFTTSTTGVNPIAAVDSITGALIGPAGLITGATFTPAKSGEYLTLFATGFGATNPSFAPGVLPSGTGTVTGSVSIQLGGVTLDPSAILYVGVSQFAGLYQLNIQVPAGIGDGNQPLVITVGGVASPGNAYVAVQN